MKSKLLACALMAGASFGALAAPAFSYNTYAGWDGTFSIKLRGYESFTGALTAGTENFGVLQVSTIYDNNNNVMWTAGQGGAEIMGVFSGIQIASVTGSAGNYTVGSTGGLANLFINAAGSFNAVGGFAQGMGGYALGGCSVATNCYNGVSNVAGGGSFLDVGWTTGVLDGVGDTTTTVNGNFTSLSTPQSGSAQGFMNVTGGTYKSLFDSNSYTFGTVGNSAADLYSKNSFCTVGQLGCASLASGGGSAANGGWALLIDDPIQGSMVPEPGSLALLGLGLMGLAASRRRKV